MKYFGARPLEIAWWILRGMPSESQDVDRLIERARMDLARKEEEGRTQQHAEEGFLSRVEAMEMRMHGRQTRATREIRAKVEKAKRGNAPGTGGTQGGFKPIFLLLRRK